MIDHAEYPLALSKLEGDAAFLYATLEDEHAAPAATSARPWATAARHGV